MLDYQEQIAEFESNYSAIVDKEVIGLSKTFDALFDPRSWYTI